MRDLAENLGIIKTHRPIMRPAGIYNTRANGVHNTAAEIDLADYNYPRKILVVVSVGEADQSQMWPFTQATLDIRIWSGLVSGALINLDYAFTQMAAPGEQIYEYTPGRRFVNVRCIVTNIVTLYVTFDVVLVTEHSRYGSMGTDD